MIPTWAVLLLLTAYVAGPMGIWALLRICGARPVVRSIFAVWWMCLGCLLVTFSTTSLICFSVVTVVLAIAWLVTVLIPSETRTIPFVMTSLGLLVASGEFVVVTRDLIHVAVICMLLSAAPVAIAERSLHPKFWRKGARPTVFDAICLSLFGACVLLFLASQVASLSVDSPASGRRYSEWSNASAVALFLLIAMCLPSRRVVPMFVTQCFYLVTLGLVSSTSIFGVARTPAESVLIPLAWMTLIASPFVLDELCNYLERQTPESDAVATE